MRFRGSGSEIKAKSDEKINNARTAFSSWQAFKEWVQVPDTALDQHGNKKYEQ